MPGSYTVKVRETDAEGKSQEIETGIVTVMVTTTAEAGDVKEGMTYIQGGESYELKTETMPVHEGKETEIKPGESITIPAGYYASAGSVSAKSLSSQTPGTATSSQILSGYSAWVNGSKINGGIVAKSGVNETIDPGESVTIPAGYYSSAGTVTAKKDEYTQNSNAKGYDHCILITNGTSYSSIDISQYLPVEVCKTLTNENFAAVNVKGRGDADSGYSDGRSAGISAFSYDSSKYTVKLGHTSATNLTARCVLTFSSFVVFY